MKDGIPMLPPGRRIELFFDTGPDRKDCGLPSIYEVIVNCDGPFGAVEPMKYTIDVDALIGAMHLNEKTVHDGVKTLEKLHRDMKSIAQKIDRLGGEES
ncbi:hypothetical protein [Actinomadura sp. 7K534]|uniref:hypothetical protein n=1 Tax=Actinomadura sp. 7K534 TaxID=2530366 RepID=UPI001050C4E8|nr:hypothetical protein [Actinomadura sp. 7K534]TDB86851.1 hypothetical protein E1266_33610 [Actinomadura sp. 7K534]